MNRGDAGRIGRGESFLPAESKPAFYFKPVHKHANDKIKKPPCLNHGGFATRGLKPEVAYLG
jgi:hypothetical protein